MVRGIVEQLLGNAATGYLDNHPEGWVLVVLVVVAFAAVGLWKLFHERGPATTASATGNKVELHLHGVAPPEASGSTNVERLAKDHAEATARFHERRLLELKQGDRPSTRPWYELTEKDKRERVFTPRTARELSALGTVTPSYQREEAIRPHLGLWIHLSGTVCDVVDDPNTDVVGVSMREDDTGMYIDMKLSLRHQQLAHALVLNTDRMDVNGKLIGISQGALSLAPVEILAYGPNVKRA